MTRHEFVARYPNASESTIRRNVGDSRPANPVQDSKPEPIVRDEPLAKAQRKESGTARVKVRVISCRRRLLDADNLAGAKFLIDALRYQGLIRDDSPDAIDLELSQMKVAKKEQEETIVVISRIPDISPTEAAQSYSQHHTL